MQLTLLTASRERDPQTVNTLLVLSDISCLHVELHVIFSAKQTAEFDACVLFLGGILLCFAAGGKWRPGAGSRRDNNNALQLNNSPTVSAAELAI